MEWFEYLKLFISGTSLVFSFGTFLFVQHDRKQRTSIKAFEDLRDKVTLIDKDLAKMPTREELTKYQSEFRDDIIRIHERVDEINQSIKTSQLQIGELIGLIKGRMS